MTEELNYHRTGQISDPASDSNAESTTSSPERCYNLRYQLRKEKQCSYIFNNQDVVLPKINGLKIQ